MSYRSNQRWKRLVLTVYLYKLSKRSIGITWTYIGELYIRKACLTFRALAIAGCVHQPSFGGAFWSHSNWGIKTLYWVSPSLVASLDRKEFMRARECKDVSLSGFAAMLAYRCTSRYSALQSSSAGRCWRILMDLWEWADSWACPLALTGCSAWITDGSHKKWRACRHPQGKLNFYRCIQTRQHPPRLLNHFSDYTLSFIVRQLVDGVQVLNNGLLLDPHDQKAISAALLKLVSDRSLWHDCRKNGLKNIHLYSWPEHCRTYLSRIALCRMRHPQWQKETRIEKGGLDSQQDSLRDESDISLQLSVDGEKLQPGSLTSPINIAQVLGNCNSQNGQQKPEQDEALTGSINKDQKMNTPENMAAFHSPGSISTRTALSIRKRKSLVVFALDNYDPTTGEPSRRPMKVIQEIFKAVRQAKSRSVGFVISSALTVSETLSQLKANGAAPQDFDALICGSGSQLYYPGGFTVSEENFDLDYKDHIDYRWGYEGLRKSMPRLMSSDEEIGPKGARSLVEDEEHCNSHCLTYKLTNISNVCKRILYRVLL